MRSSLQPSECGVALLAALAVGLPFPASAGELLAQTWSHAAAQPNGFEGTIVAPAGDVNADGFADFVVGGWGIVHIGFLGSPTGPAATPDWDPGGFGWGVSGAGDVNGDGFDDVAVDSTGYVNQLAVYDGSAAGFGAAAAWVFPGAFGGGETAAGDVNGDGFGDVVAGDPYYRHGQANEGELVVFAGSAAGLPASPTWRAESNLADDWMGGTLAAAGDVDGDGFDDVLVGSPGYDAVSPGFAKDGRARLFAGSPAGIGGAATWVVDGQPDAGFATSIASAGDVDGDGYDDVLVGAPDTSAAAGEASLYLGSAVGLGAGVGWSTVGANAGDRVGQSVASAGDVDGDGYGDVVIGAALSVHGGYSWANGGFASVYRGGPAGLDAAPVWTHVGSEPAPLAGEAFGISVAGPGDVDGDGYGDVLVGADQAADPNVYGGKTYLFGGACFDGTGDADGDGTGDACDVCPGGDDAVDTDLDGTPDACDSCPGGVCPAVAITGVCPGALSMDLTGFTPGGQVALFRGTSGGATVLPGGPCPGAVLDLGGAKFVVAKPVDANGARNVAFSPGSCGSTVQVLDVATCEVSNTASF